MKTDLLPAANITILHALLTYLIGLPRYIFKGVYPEFVLERLYIRSKPSSYKTIYTVTLATELKVDVSKHGFAHNFVVRTGKNIIYFRK